MYISKSVQGFAYFVLFIFSVFVNVIGLIIIQDYLNRTKTLVRLLHCQVRIAEEFAWHSSPLLNSRYKFILHIQVNYADT